LKRHARASRQFGLVGGEMTVSAEVTVTAPEAPEVRRSRHTLRTSLLGVAVVVVVVVALALYWAYSYNPLARSWQQVTKGEWGSYAGSPSGVEARHTTSAVLEGSPMGTVTWVEPAGAFFVQFETEISNTGSHAVKIDTVGQPKFGYRTSGYRVAFYKNVQFPHEAGAAFHPFVLAGHAERRVVVSYSQFCATGAPDEIVTANGTVFSGPLSIPVTYSFLGFTRTDEVPIEPTAFEAPSRC
jgi:hypothetical protein